MELLDAGILPDGYLEVQILVEPKSHAFGDDLFSFKEECLNYTDQ